jgi:hypothetical protein
MLTIAEYDSHPRVRRQAEALVARGDSVTAVALHADGRPALEMVDGVNVVRLPVRNIAASRRRPTCGCMADSPPGWHRGRPAGFATSTLFK